MVNSAEKLDPECCCGEDEGAAVGLCEAVWTSTVEVIVVTGPSVYILTFCISK